MKRRNHHPPISTSQDWAAVIADYRQSGLSLQEFARERGLHPGRLHYRVYQKNQDGESRSLARESRADSTVGFREVKLEADSVLLQSWAAEVSVAPGVNIRFSGAARPEWIGAVIQALQRPC